ncbi:MAG: thioredoxin family protein [Candidatus Aenigmarchaeota archaeon]|nr:thioredoxin family protein [Candidatus Aenigmarchaeota archaeon]
MRLKAGQQAPDFSLKGVGGKTYSLASFKNKKIIIVMFYCNHCPYAKGSEARIIELQRVYGPKGVQVIAVNSNDDENYPEDSFENMVVRAKEKGYNFPYLRDETQAVARAYGGEVTPDCFVLDEKRVVRYTGRIDDSPKDANAVASHDLKLVLDALLAGKEPPFTERRAIGCSIKWKAG